MNNRFFTETEFSAWFSCAREPLTGEKEIDLSKRILAGKAAEKALADAADLSDDERMALRHTADDGKDAFDSLVLANQPRAVKFAADTFRRNPFGLNDFEDYLQTAMRVVCEAAQTYDWRRGCRFSTWVHQQLKQEMIRENALTAYAVRIPEDNLYRITGLTQKAEQEGIGAAAKAMGMTRESAEKLLLAGKPCKSFQDPMDGEDPDMELGDIVADTSAMTAEEIGDMIDQQAEWDMLREAFPRLSAEDQQLLLGRMGFTRGAPIPMKEFIGVCAKSTSGVQKRQQAAENRLKGLLGLLPLAG